jgi:probable F420-dependent oxidoreductase
MDLGTYSVMAFTDGLSPDQLAELGQRTEALGYKTLWYPEVYDYEAMVQGAFLLSKTDTLIVANGIANIYARDPMAAAQGYNALNKLYGDRFILGLGVSHQAMLDIRGGGHVFGKPVPTMRQYLDDMDQAWEVLGGAFNGEKRLVLAGLGPGLQKLAAERTMGTMPYNYTPEMTANARQTIGADTLLIAEQKVCYSTDPVVARAAARRSLAFYLTFPRYHEIWSGLGYNEEDWNNGGSDRLMDAMVVWGTEVEIRKRLTAHLDAGANQVGIQSLRPDGELGPDWNALEALAPQ